MMDVIVVNLVREGINKHRARELAEHFIKYMAGGQDEPVAWRDHVEQRLLTWRQSFVNKSGDQLALADFMGKESIDDLIDFVCDEYVEPPQRQWVGLTRAGAEQLVEDNDWYNDPVGFCFYVEAKLKEKNNG